MWAELAGEPTFILTGDQDWAPSWALQRWLDAGDGDPMHLFVTNADDRLGDLPDDVTLGIHPNFLPGSTHGADPLTVIEHCLDLVPGATTVRSHAFTESTTWLDALAAAGLRVDSNLCTRMQPGLTPLLHISGLVRLPVFLEDDVVLRTGRVPEVDEIAPWLFSPGLKVLNFHPALVAINARSLDDYAAARPGLYGGGRFRPHRDRGVADLLADLLHAIHSEGHAVVAFPEVGERAIELASAYAPVDAEYPWHRALRAVRTGRFG